VPGPVASALGLAKTVSVYGAVAYTRNIDSNQQRVTAANVGVRVSGLTGSPLSKTALERGFFDDFSNKQELRCVA
jgi:hypothetical protein